MPINLSGSANRAASTVFGSGIIKALRNQNKINEQLTEANTTAQERLQIAMNQKRDTEYQVANIKDPTAYDWNNPKFQAYLTNIDRQKASNLRRQTVNRSSEEYINSISSMTTWDEAGNFVQKPFEYDKQSAKAAVELGLRLNSKIRNKTAGYSPNIETILGASNGQVAQSILDEWNDWSQLPSTASSEDLDKDMEKFVDYLGSDEYYDKYKDYDIPEENRTKRRTDYMNKLYDDLDKWEKEHPEASDEDKEMERNAIDAELIADEENEINWNYRKDIVHAIRNAIQSDLKEKDKFMEQMAKILEGGDK